MVVCSNKRLLLHLIKTTTLLLRGGLPPSAPKHTDLSTLRLLAAALCLATRLRWAGAVASSNRSIISSIISSLQVTSLSQMAISPPLL